MAGDRKLPRILEEKCQYFGVTIAVADDCGIDDFFFFLVVV